MKKLAAILILLTICLSCHSTQVESNGEVEAKVLGVIPVSFGKECYAYRLQINGKEYGTDNILAPYSQPGTIVKITYQQNAACVLPTAGGGQYIIKITSIHQ